LTATLKQFNLALRGLMEFGIILAFGYWGYRTGGSLATRILLAVIAPALVFGFWGLVDFHRAGSVAEPLRMVEELVISGLAAAALYIAGAPLFGLALAVISVMHHALVYPLGETLLKQS
jgi:hypothetical protein